MPFIFGKESLRNLSEVHPDLQKVAHATLQKTPIDFKVIEGRRTITRQRELFDAGFTKTLNSPHLTGYAIDIWPFDPESKKAVSGRDNEKLWELLRTIAGIAKETAIENKIYLVWGGDWGWDAPHLELSRKHYNWKEVWK